MVKTHYGLEKHTFTKALAYTHYLLQYCIYYQVVNLHTDTAIRRIGYRLGIYIRYTSYCLQTW